MFDVDLTVNANLTTRGGDLQAKALTQFVENVGIPVDRRVANARRALRECADLIEPF